MRRWLAYTSVIFLLAAEARAESRGRDDVREAGEPSVEAARHFEAALDYYRSGKYREALGELEVAYGLDPTGKDLVYNLAVVSEKLGRFDDAIHYLARYLELETEEKELERTRDAIRRLEGARAELARRPTATTRQQPCPVVAPAPAKAPGKLDEWVYATGGLSAAALIVGTVLGVQAIARDPRGESTGDGVDVDELEARVNQAKDLARLADIAFAVSLLSGSGALLLYFGRTPDSPRHAELRLSGSF